MRNIFRFFFHASQLAINFGAVSKLVTGQPDEIKENNFELEK